MRRLITISASHYCEKARWALDRAGLDYSESGHLPHFHYFSSFRAARSPFVPILVDGCQTITDSTDIVRYVDSHLPNEDRLFPKHPFVLLRDVEWLEQRFDEELGPSVRRWAYWHWFTTPRDVVRHAGKGAPWIERALAPVGLGLAKRLTFDRYTIDERSAKSSMAKVDEIFREVERYLSDGRRFLTGSTFTAADLTFAALAGLVLAPPNYGGPLPPPEETSPAMGAEIARLRATAAGAFVLRLYDGERQR